MENNKTRRRVFYGCVALGQMLKIVKEFGLNSRNSPLDCELLEARPMIYSYSIT